MNDLAQRLKDLDAAKFEELCFQIWSEKLPGADLHHVEGKAGDKGTDLFAGTLAGKPAIWQCKFFRDGIKDAQKKQIKKSLKTALHHFTPHLWTLCIPVNLDINAHSRFQRFEREHADVKLELFDASMIVKELIFRRPIRNFFFPGVVLDVTAIRAMLLGTGSYTDGQLAAIADENVEQYIERLREKEPRYDYQVSYHSGNSGIGALQGAMQILPPNTIMSSWDGNRRVDLVVRDLEAIRKDPPHVTLTVNAEGATKVQNALRTGSPLKLEGDELVGFKSSFDFLMSPELLQQPFGLLLTPRFPKAHESFRVSFEKDDDRIVYDLIEFDMTGRHFGVDGMQKVVELASTSTHVPFRMNLSFSLDDLSASFELRTGFSGYDVLDVEKCLNAIRVLKSGGSVDLFDLKRGKSIGAVNAQVSSLGDSEGDFERITHDLAEISKAFGQRFIAPDVITKRDLETLAFLLEVCRRGEIAGGTVENFTGSLVRDERPLGAVLERLADEFMVGVENDSYPIQSLLGNQISVGPCRLIIERASLQEFEEVKKRYEALSLGESMRVAINPGGPIRRIFLRFYRGEPLPPLVPA